MNSDEFRGKMITLAETILETRPHLSKVEIKRQMVALCSKKEVPEELGVHVSKTGLAQGFVVDPISIYWILKIGIMSAVFLWRLGRDRVDLPSDWESVIDKVVEALPN